MGRFYLKYSLEYLTVFALFFFDGKEETRKPPTEFQSPLGSLTYYFYLFCLACACTLFEKTRLLKLPFRNF